MSEDNQQPTDEANISILPLLIGVGIFVVFAAVFVIEFLDFSDGEGGLEDEAITADAYMAEVAPLIAGADPARAPEHLADYGCTSCHGNNLAPSYDVVQVIAAERREPMQAVAYIYESIIHPGAFVVDGYQNNMPRTYEGTFLNGDEADRAALGDIILYLAGEEAAQVVEASQPEATAEASTDSDVEATAESTAEAEGVDVNEAPTETTDEDGIQAEPLTEAMINEYESVAEFMLAGASAERGEALVDDYGCTACHGGNAAGVIAPGYAGLSENATLRRPELSPEAYVYESIMYPGHYVVDGWPNSMPKTYEDLIASTDLGDIMAYILQVED